MPAWFTLKLTRNCLVVTLLLLFFTRYRLSFKALSPSLSAFQFDHAVLQRLRTPNLSRPGTFVSPAHRWFSIHRHREDLPRTDFAFLQWLHDCALRDHPRLAPLILP